MHSWGANYAVGNAADTMFPAFSMMLLWIAVIAGIAYLIFYLRKSSGPVPIEQKSSSAEEILRERFARGEIDKEEYEQRIKVLRI